MRAKRLSPRPPSVCFPSSRSCCFDSIVSTAQVSCASRASHLKTLLSPHLSLLFCVSAWGPLRPSLVSRLPGSLSRVASTPYPQR